VSIRAQYWSWVAGWVTLIYSTLYFVPGLVEFIQERTPFDLLTNMVVLLAVGGLIFGYLLRRGFRKPSSYVLCSFVILCYIYGLSKIRFPAEKIHFIEYGVLAYFLYRALRLDVKRSLAYVSAFIMAGLLGWIDEGIQGFLPNRYYELVDVRLNCISAALGLLLIYVFERERGG